MAQQNEERQLLITPIKVENLTEFPHEILLNIFTFLEPKDLFTLSLVNHQFAQFLNDDMLWKEAYAAHFSSAETQHLKVQQTNPSLLTKIKNQFSNLFKSKEEPTRKELFKQKTQSRKNILARFAKEDNKPAYLKDTKTSKEFFESIQKELLDIAQNKPSEVFAYLSHHIEYINNASTSDFQNLMLRLHNAQAYFVMVQLMNALLAHDIKFDRPVFSSVVREIFKNQTVSTPHFIDFCMKYYKTSERKGVVSRILEKSMLFVPESLSIINLDLISLSSLLEMSPSEYLKVRIACLIFEKLNSTIDTFVNHMLSIINENDIKWLMYLDPAILVSLGQALKIKKDPMLDSFILAFKEKFYMGEDIEKLIQYGLVEADDIYDQKTGETYQQHIDSCRSPTIEDYRKSIAQKELSGIDFKSISSFLTENLTELALKDEQSHNNNNNNNQSSFTAPSSEDEQTVNSAVKPDVKLGMQELREKRLKFFEKSQVNNNNKSSTFSESDSEEETPDNASTGSYGA